MKKNKAIKLQKSVNHQFSFDGDRLEDMIILYEITGYQADMHQEEDFWSSYTTLTPRRAATINDVSDE